MQSKEWRQEEVIVKVRVCNMGRDIVWRREMITIIDEAWWGLEPVSTSNMATMATKSLRYWWRESLYLFLRRPPKFLRLIRVLGTVSLKDVFRKRSTEDTEQITTHTASSWWIRLPSLHETFFDDGCRSRIGFICKSGKVWQGLHTTFMKLSFQVCGQRCLHAD